MNASSRSLQQIEFTAFDLETTGLHPVSCRIVEIGAIRFRGDGTVLGEFEQLVDPGRPIPPSAIRIHGITDEAVAGQPSIRDVLPRFAEFIGGGPAILLAHNAAFDVGFLSVECRRVRYTPPEHKVIDTCGLARRRLKLANYKLDTLGRHYGLIEIEEHRALSDAVLLKDVFLRLIRERPAIRSEGRLLEHSPVLSFQDLGAILDDPPPGFEELWESIADERPVEMTYMGGSTPGATRAVTPLGVIQTRGQLYLTAVCHQSHCEKTFRLDRIAAYRKIS